MALTERRSVEGHLDNLSRDTKEVSGRLDILENEVAAIKQSLPAPINE